MRLPFLARAWLLPVASAGLVALLATVPADRVASTAYAQAGGAAPPPCAPPTSGGPPPVQPTTITTIEQAYDCIFAHYFGGAGLDDRPLLSGAFAGLTQELARLGKDQADATLPPFSGDRAADWTAFSALYQRLTAELPADPAVLQAVAAATLTGMVGSLHDNHARWVHQEVPPGFAPGDAYGLGIVTSPGLALATNEPQEALPPLFVSAIQGGPAADRGLRPGDIILAVDGAPPFVDGVVSEGVIGLLTQQFPQDDPVRVTLRRPATGRTWTVTMKPALFQLSAAASAPFTSRLLPGDVAYVALAGFSPNAVDGALQAIADMSAGRTLKGVVLDLRGNRGGSPVAVARLLGAFVHGKVWSYDCDPSNVCRANQTNDGVALLHLPLVVLTDRDCASACDAFSGAVKDLGIGPLVGTRTSGIVAGPATGYLLTDNSDLLLPSEHELGANREIINGIGVAPDYLVPLTAQDLSAGRDPDVARALSLLAG
ncbi:MAG: peptidase [Chloroflexi bacterium]|nr:MAG: peptidase [Chloroflexota bacterium]